MRIHGGKQKIEKDFSVNTNPLGPPEELLEILRTGCSPERVMTRYPDYDYRDLRGAISSFYNTDPEEVVPLNGSSEGLVLLVLSIKPRKIYALEPTFGDHRIMCRALGIDYEAVRYVEEADMFIFREDLFKTACRDRSSMIILSNPNNPTGAYIDIKKIAELALKCSATVVADEAYAELCEECPVDPIDVPENLVILRSLTKWLSIPGLRIGFMITSRQTAEIIDSVRPPWNINSIADCAVTRLLKIYRGAMRRFIEDSRRYVSVEREYLSRGLKELGFRVYRSHVNYILTKIEVDCIDQVLEELSRNGIAVRDCSSFEGLGKGYIRISIRKREDNKHLLGIISKIKQR